MLLKELHALSEAAALSKGLDNVRSAYMDLSYENATDDEPTLKGLEEFIDDMLDDKETRTGHELKMSELNAAKKPENLAKILAAIKSGRVDEAKQWTGDVKEKWHPPEGFFEKSASAIVSGLMAASKDQAQAMQRLNFYINRAGKNLSAEDKARLESAKKKLEAKGTKD